MKRIRRLFLPAYRLDFRMHYRIHYRTNPGMYPLRERYALAPVATGCIYRFANTGYEMMSQANGCR